MSKFTPGPWSVYEYEDGANVVVNGTFLIVGIEDLAIDLEYFEKGYQHWGDDKSLTLEIPIEEQKANAHLIAAAPEMYDELERLKGCMLVNRDLEHIDRIEKLLAKARGEQLYVFGDSTIESINGDAFERHKK